MRAYGTAACWGLIMKNDNGSTTPSLNVEILKSGAAIVEFEVAGTDPEDLRDQLKAACLAAASLGYDFATMEDASGATVQIPTDADDFVVTRSTRITATS